MAQIAISRMTAPLWYIVAACCGIAWNAFGAVQFAASLTASAADLMASGMTAEQAAVMTGYPMWMTVAFGIGVAGGLIGSALLLLRSRQAVPVFAVSLIAYIALWIGDAVHGVFAALGAPQVIIVSIVVAIAAGLFLFARRATAA